MLHETDRREVITNLLVWISGVLDKPVERGRSLTARPNKELHKGSTMNPNNQTISVSGD
jgi:hypothetical protein